MALGTEAKTGMKRRNHNKQPEAKEHAKEQATVKRTPDTAHAQPNQAAAAKHAEAAEATKVRRGSRLSKKTRRARRMRKRKMSKSGAAKKAHT